jgi:homoserine O-acetyltransferase
VTGDGRGDGGTAGVAAAAVPGPGGSPLPGGEPAQPRAAAADGASAADGAATTPEPPRPPGEVRFGSGRVETCVIGRLALESGAVLEGVHVAYRHDGPGPDEAPQVVLVHALTGSADAAGDWWAPVVGPGKALDTDRVGVLCANLLGGRYGTTGPTSRDPATGRAYGRSFPAVTPRDMARAQWHLLDALGIGHVALLAGGSLGGMVAQEVALERPAAVTSLLSIAAPAGVGALALAWDHIQLELVDRFGEEGMDLARRLALTTYRSEADFDARFGRGREDDGRLSIVSYLVYQGQKLVDRFDPETYRTLVTAMDAHDVGRDRGGIEAAFRALSPGPGRGVTAGAGGGVGGDAGAGGGPRDGGPGAGGPGTIVTGVGIAGDILYGPVQVRALVDAARAAGVDARYLEFQSDKGHDAFLVEWAVLDRILRGALDEAVAAAAVGRGDGPTDATGGGR